MADELELASEREEIARNSAARVRRPEGPTATGRCLYCDELVAEHQRWCDAECRDQWEAHRGH